MRFCGNSSDCNHNEATLHLGNFCMSDKSNDGERPAIKSCNTMIEAMAAAENRLVTDDATVMRSVKTANGNTIRKSVMTNLV